MASATETPTQRMPFLKGILKYNAVIMLIILFIISGMMSSAFLSQGNLFNILRQITLLLLVSIGMLLVINTGGIDLSVGSVAAASGIILPLILIAIPFDGPGAVLVAVFGTLIASAIFGAVIGMLVTVFGLAPFIVTLAVITIARGLSFTFSNGQPVPLPFNMEATRFFDAFGSYGVPGIGVP